MLFHQLHQTLSVNLSSNHLQKDSSDLLPLVQKLVQQHINLPLALSLVSSEAHLSLQGVNHPTLMQKWSITLNTLNFASLANCSPETVSALIFYSFYFIDLVNGES